MRLRAFLIVLGLGPLLLMPINAGAATSSLRISTQVPTTLSSAMPIARLTFSRDVTSAMLPPLVVHPNLETEWQQVGPREVQAVAVTRLRPQVRYRVEAPTTMRCANACQFFGVRTLTTDVVTNIAWEEQLLAETGYLPLSFSPTQPPSDPSQPVPGTYTWLYPQLPTVLVAQWRVGVANPLVTGALMAFQDQHQLSPTGVADPTTWDDLLSAAQHRAFDPATYNYVLVSETEPETLTLYVAGVATFHTLVNTGISVAPTSLGTYPVYLRYTSQTMTGTNPDGSHYSDPGIPWISYFNGGEALHGFIRDTYGWPQSLGCVEMPFASAKTVWPYTPIGTLVTVTS